MEEGRTYQSRLDNRPIVSGSGGGRRGASANARSSSPPLRPTSEFVSLDTCRASKEMDMRAGAFALFSILLKTDGQVAEGERWGKGGKIENGSRKEEGVHA